MKFFWLIIGIFSLSVTGCGEDVFTGDPGNMSNTIHSFTVSGSGGDTQEPVLLDSVMDSGQFSIAWSVSSSNPYDYYVSISNSENFALGGEFFNGGGNCVGANCTDNLVFNCILTIVDNSPSIACDDDTGVTIPLTIPSIDPSLYMVFKLCRSQSEECTEKAVEINIS